MNIREDSRLIVLIPHKKNDQRKPAMAAVGVLATALLLLSSAQLAAQISPAEDASASFQCPEAYTTDAAKQKALQEFLESYTKKFPENNQRDFMVYRYRLLVAHSCIQTLKFMSSHVSPISEMLFLQDRSFGPKTKEFNSKTQVWSVHFRKDGETPELSNEELIFNFYEWKPATTADAVAHAFLAKRKNLQILGSFEAPDDATKEPAYFVVSENHYPGDPYVFINVSKISSVGKSVYCVTFAKTVTAGSSADAEAKGKAWFLSDEGRGFASAIAHLGIEGGWEDYFASSRKQ